MTLQNLQKITPQKMTLQKKATLISSLTAFLLICVKFFTGILSGSVAILASAIDSLLDLCASLFNLFALSKSEKPADLDYNYGLGKIESLASIIEGSAIIISGLFIFYQSCKKLYLGEVIEHLDLSLGVMIFSFVVTLGLVIYLQYVAKVTQNLVIKADALHYKTDLLSNGAIFISLGLIAWSGWDFIDGILGIVVALYILHSSYSLLKEGISILLDKALEPSLVAQIQAIIAQEPQITAYHNLKTRQSAEIFFVEVHLVFNPTMTLFEAHMIADRVEQNITKLQGQWKVITHLDPYDDGENE